MKTIWVFTVVIRDAISMRAISIACFGTEEEAKEQMVQTIADDPELAGTQIESQSCSPIPQESVMAAGLAISQQIQAERLEVLPNTRTQEPSDLAN